MTDAWLMEADCLHGVAWYDCILCDAVTTVELNEDEWDAMVEASCQRHFGHGLEEFLAKWRTGEYSWSHDNPLHCDIASVAMLIRECNT